MSGAVLPYDFKRRREVVTPEGVVLPFVVATRAARFGAFMLDYIFLMVGTVAGTLLITWIAGGIGALDSPGGSGANEFLGAIWTLFWFLAWNGYFMAFELGPRGATPGKRIARIRVAARPRDGVRGGGDAPRLTAEAVIARNLLRDIELFMPLVFLVVAPSGQAGSAGLAGMLWFLVFMLFPFFNRDALRAGDVVAGTWVVEAPRVGLPAVLSAEGAARGPSAVTGAQYRFGDRELSVYGEHELQALERILRDNVAESIVPVHEAICRKIGWNPGSGDERAFLEAYYAQLRARLEGEMRFGRRKADKFS